MKKAVNVGVDEFKDCICELSRRLYRLKQIRHTQLLLIARKREKERIDKSNIHLPIIHLSLPPYQTSKPRD